MFCMKKFLVALNVIFILLIIGSVQSVLATDITDVLKPVSIKNSEYLFHLQVVLRDIDGRLVSVVESTNGYYIPHAITDGAFDKHFGKKEVVSIDNMKYEKVQYTETYSLDLPGKLMFFITAFLNITDEQEIITVDAHIFQAFVPFVYLEEGDVINTQWTIFRELD